MTRPIREAETGSVFFRMCSGVCIYVQAIHRSLQPKYCGDIYSKGAVKRTENAVDIVASICRSHSGEKTHEVGTRCRLKRESA